MTARPRPQVVTEPALRLVVSRPIRVPRLGQWLVFTVAVVIAFFALIVSRTALDRSAFVLQELEREVAAQELRYHELRLEVARLSSPDRVWEAAEQMGLVIPPGSLTISAPGVRSVTGDGIDDGWSEVKSVMSAQP